jgi:hypothetical protein
MAEQGSGELVVVDLGPHQRVDHDRDRVSLLALTMNDGRRRLLQLPDHPAGCLWQGRPLTADLRSVLEEQGVRQIFAEAEVLVKDLLLLGRKVAKRATTMLDPQAVESSVEDAKLGVR